VQNKHIFLSVWEDALENLSTFNETYNNAIREKNISDMHPVESNALPFWRHCTCGAKAAMHILDGRASGMCPSCGSDLSFELEDLKKVFSGLSPTAVSRNIFFAEGLGTSLFVSGSGGSLVYGKISNRVSARLGYFIPQTVAWKGRDYYIGPVQRKALEGLGLAVGCNLLKNPQIIPSAVASREQELQNRINKSLSDKKAVQKYSGQLTSLKLQLGIAKKIFSLDPSFVDELASRDSKEIAQSWSASLRCSEVVLGDDASIIKSIEESGVGIKGVYDFFACL